MSPRLPVAQLPPVEKNLLILMALLQVSLSQNKWLDVVRLTDVRNPQGKALAFADIKAAMQTLLQQGWVYQPAGAGYQLDLRYEQTRMFQVFEYLFSVHEVERWLALARSWLLGHAGRGQYIGRRAYHRRELWFALLDSDVAAMDRLISAYLHAEPDEGSFPLEFLADPGDGSLLFSHLSTALQNLVLQHSLMAAVYQLPDCPHLYAVCQQFLVQHPTHLPLLELMAWHALQCGDVSAVEQFVAQYPDEGAVLAAILTLRTGDVASARQQFILAGERLKKRAGKRKISFAKFDGWFYLLTLFCGQSAADLPLIEYQIGMGGKQQDGFCYTEFALLYEQQCAPASRLDFDPDDYVSSEVFDRSFDSLLSALVLHWVTPLPAEVLAQLVYQRDWLFDAGYEWVAAEFDAIIAAASQQSRQWPDWHEKQGLQPLCTLMQQQEFWQQALQALNTLKTDGRPDAVSAEKTSRLCWFLAETPYRLTLEPREQKLNAKGQWSAGRAVALKRLVNDKASLSCISEQDLPVIRCIEVSYQGYYGGETFIMNTEKALQVLPGHPLVFWDGAPQVPVQIREGAFHLKLEQLRQQYRLSLQPEEVLNGRQLWQKETPTSLQVYRKTEQLHKIHQILGTGLLVPAAGKAQLLETVSALAGQLPVQSELAELSAAIETVAPDLRLYGHLLPWQQGLRFQLLVRPLPDGPWFKPGKGSSQLVGDIAGKAVQTRRELADEQLRLQQLTDACPALLEAGFDGSQWLLDEPALCLELLEQLHGQPPELLSLVWPQGEKFRIRAKAKLKDLQLHIRQQGNWLTLEGELQLDENKVLSLRELLNLVRTTQGRFIALDDQDYLALTESFRQQLAELDQLPGKTTDDGVQLSPLTAPLVAQLAEGAGEVRSNKAWQNQLATLNTLEQVCPVPPSTLQAELRDYQQQGFVWLARLAHWGVGACLADDMGLGKTVQTLALLLHRAAGGPALVVAPLSVANNWRSEAARFAPTLKLRWYHEVRDLSALGPFDLVICSYGLLQGDSEQFAAQHWHTLVLDEAQAIKNADTKRAKAALSLTADFRLVATGTPVENHLGELWSLFQFINPGLLGSKEQFSQRFSGPIEQGDHNVRLLLKKLLQPFILRRTKTQVLSELPARTEIQLNVELSSEELHLYEALRQQALERLAGQEDGQAMQVLAEIMRLRRFCCHPSLVLPDSQLAGSKLAVFAETLTELLDNKHKVLVFSQFVDHLAIVRRYLDEQQVAYQYLDGSTSVGERKKRVDAFQSGQGEVFLISLKAGGSGLNLTAADYVIHLDPWWNPAVEDQASDRAHRIGQTRPVTIYRLVTQQTIEQKILALHAEKRALADSLLEGGDLAARLDTQQLLALMRH